MSLNKPTTKEKVSVHVIIDKDLYLEAKKAGIKFVKAYEHMLKNMILRMQNIEKEGVSNA